MKLFRNYTNSVSRRPGVLPATLAWVSLFAIAIIGWQARAALPRWMQDVVGASSVEAALYRAMEMPGVRALYPRPPKEAQEELSGLIAKAANQSANQAELYSLRAMEEEQALDFKAAEADWKSFAALSAEKTAAKIELADYYHRRMQAADEVETLMQVGVSAQVVASRAATGEVYVPAAEQRSWKAFERILVVAADQRLGDAIVGRTYTAWIERYPQQPSLYAREFHWLLDEKKYSESKDLLNRYRSSFPNDQIFPVKAAALLEYRQGSADKALEVYASQFTPLWPAELIESFYSLLAQTHHQRRFLADARGRLAQNPDDLNAMARLFYAAQQQGNLVSAQEVIEGFRISKESRKAAWSAEELQTLAHLTEAIHAYPEAARYNFALSHTAGTMQAEGLSGLVRILLIAPDEPIALGAGNLSMYQDIATLDQGPGYWNGILSLWLNSTSPRQAFHEEEQRARPYFHRTKAAELLALLDRDYPHAAERATLHGEMIQAFADYGESAMVLKAGSEYLASFPASMTSTDAERDRIHVAMLMADAYARQQDTKSEFTLYDRLLEELIVPSAGMPLTAAVASKRVTVSATNSEGNSEQSAGAEQVSNTNGAGAFDLAPGQPAGIIVPGALEYQVILERYLGRLTATGQLPQALAVLRRELDHNPNDPALYERLASFLEQNNLSAQQEEVYQQAIQKFQQKDWYDKLARLYLREKKREAFADLTRKVTDIFHGTELENYFQQVTLGGPQLFLQLNLYAHQRFPHDQVFVGNLLEAYQAKDTRNDAAWEKLLREHWADSAALRTEFFDYLNRSGKLEAELSRLHELVPAAGLQKANPAATRELAEAELWRSHFEASAPLLGDLAEAYPAEEEIGSQASSIFRSLAYFDSAQTLRAVAIEKHLLAARPDDADRLARIGDIYSDSGASDSGASDSGLSDSGANVTGHENLAAAAPYWRRIAALHPGSSNGYQQAATVFWDYFQFDEALQQIHEARTRFAQPNLYGYEAGAIEEGKRNLAAAIHEYAAAGTDDVGASSAAATRLLQLARRSASAKLVDDETARMAEHGDIAAIELRVRVLKVQKRMTEIAPLLDAALAKVVTFDQAQEIATQAQANSLTTIYEHALTRQIVLVNDPIEKIELSYTLSQSLEGRKRTGEAARVIEDIYHDNPKLLGVVRATTDFYWRNKQPEKAIATLVEAARQADPAQPALAHEFVVEAASKANDSGNYQQARNLVAPLLDARADPYNAQYLAVVADSYARPGDSTGLKQFYLDKLDSIRNAATKLGPTKLSPDERRQKTVLLRRGLIPALTRLKDYAGGVDQYVAILSAYPEDSGTIEEASLYALRYSRQPQLITFVSNTVKDSPRDSRFYIMLAQMQTTLENYPAAIEAYTHTIAIRADRADVLAAKADLEERLQRLEDACKDYERLYKLSYQNPDWMLRVATVRARQGRKEDAVKALERTWIQGHPPTAANYFRVATQLEKWNMLDESLRFAESGVKTEGDDLLGGSAPGNQNGDDPAGAALYARLLTRMRQAEKLLAVLDEARKAAEVSTNSPSVVMQQVEKQGIASVTDGAWRRQRVEQRRQTAAQRYRGALLAMGETVATYFTPEEKQHFSRLLDSRWALADHAVWAERSQWIEVAHAAGTLDVEARFRRQIMLDRSYESGAPSDAQYEAYQALQRSRMEYADLGQTLEAYALLRKAEDRRVPRIAAAEAWRNAGDEGAEIRALRRVSFAGNNNAYLRERYLQLLLKHDPDGFTAFASSSNDEATGLASPNYAVAHSSWKVALAALSAHSRIFGAAWQSASTALLGLYFRDSSPITEAAFHSALEDDETVGQRIDAQGKVDRSQQLAGGVWFYYGMRYGVYRTLAAQKDWPQRDPEDFLAAGLERNPVAASSYVVLARAYADAGVPELALAEYGHALELTQDAPAVHDAMALLLWQSDQAGAIAHWRDGLTALNRVQDKAAAPESFWSNFALIARHVGARKVAAQLRPEMDTLLRNFIARNGNYRSDELLKAAFLTSGSADEGVSWILSLSTAATAPEEVVGNLANAEWLPRESREPVLLRQLELARVAASRDRESAQSYRAEQLLTIQKTLATYYFDQQQQGKAEAQLQQLDKGQQSSVQRKDSELITLRIRIAARNQTLSKLLGGWADNADTGQSMPGAPDSQLLRGVAATLAAQGDKADALALWEFIFERGQSNHDLLVSDYIGFADARLQSKEEAGNVESAVAILRRMTLLAGDIETNYDLAAGLLEKRGRSSEAVEFLLKLANAVPWKHVYQLRLAQARLRTASGNSGHGGADQALASLRILAADTHSDYGLRTEAAMALRRAKAGTGAPLGSVELQLLAGGNVTPQQAGQPYFVAARMVAADALPDAGKRVLLLREAISIRPNDRGDFAGAGDLPLQLFRAEAEAGHPARALVLLDAMRSGNYRRPSSTSAPLDDAAAEDATGDNTEGAGEIVEDTTRAEMGIVDSEEEDPYEAHPASEADSKLTLAQLQRLAPLPAGSLTDADKLALTLQVAGVYEQTDSAVSAVPYLELAVRLEPDAARRTALLHRIDQIKTTWTLNERNSQRRPTIQRALDQGTLVRPRLSAAELVGNRTGNRPATPAREVAR